MQRTWHIITWNCPSFPPPPTKKRFWDKDLRAINIGREENANSKVKKPDREGKVGQEECYQSSYYSETLELNPPGELQEFSYPTRGVRKLWYLYKPLQVIG